MENQGYFFAIITSNENGYASLLMDVIGQKKNQCILVINRNSTPIPVKKRLKKIARIGILGALLGAYFRKHYQQKFVSGITIAKKYAIPVILLSNFKPDEHQKAQLEKISIGISMGNGYIPSTFFSLFKYGMINIHHEILPDYPGAQSVVWPLIEGRAETGFSIHRINKGIDKGELLLVKKRPIRFYSSLMQTVRENYRESLQLSVDSLAEVLKTNPQEWHFMPNTASKSYTTPSFFQWLKAFQNHRKLGKREA